MLHPASELRFVNSSIGYGVFATDFIPRGTIIWVFDELDQVITPERAANLHPDLFEIFDKYSYLNGRGERILCWDHSRFVNHSCNPTSLAPGFDMEIAIRDIQEGEEITDDYGSLNVERPFTCECGTDECRKIVGSDDFDRYSERWDALVAQAFPLIQAVDQPLWNLVPNKAAITTVLEGRAPVPSCRAHFCGMQTALHRAASG